MLIQFFSGNPASVATASSRPKALDTDFNPPSICLSGPQGRQLPQGMGCSFFTSKKSSQGWPTHLTDATPAALHGVLFVLLVILLDLLREESVEDLIDQLGGGGFCGPFALHFGRIDDRAPCCSPEGEDHHFRDPDAEDCLLWSQASDPSLDTSLPLSQGDTGQMDQGPHTGRQEDGRLIIVLSVVVTFYLAHHKLGMA